MSKQDFLEFERRCDEMIENLPLLTFPLRTVLTACYGVADSLFHGSRFGGTTGRRLMAAHALSCRFSYLVPNLLKCPLEPIGVSAEDAVSPMTEERFKELAFLVNYGSLCEVAPEVRRGYFSVASSNSKSNYTLTHIDNYFAEAEARDIILNELALPFFMVPQIIESSFFDKQVMSLPIIDPMGIFGFIPKYVRWFVDNLFECPMISSDALYKTLGVSIEQFELFRATWMSIAQYYIEMAAAISRVATSGNQTLKERFISEFLEWQTPYLKEEFLRSVVMNFAKLNAQQYDTLMTIYCFDPLKQNAAGDGFFPPIARLNNGLLFHPNVVQIMLSSRNIPYALNKINKKLFDTVLSPTLEPRLLDVAVKLFQNISQIATAQNIQWSGGEIDTLVYDSERNTAIHIQAKSAMPPQGSRMVRSVESRVLEGIKQLGIFREAPQSMKDDIISRTFSVTARNVKIIDALLVWSSFGTQNIWKELCDVAPLNIPILYTLVDRNPLLNISEIKDLAWELIDEIIEKASPRWTKETLQIGQFSIEMPILEYDEYSILNFKKHLAACL